MKKHPTIVVDNNTDDYKDTLIQAMNLIFQATDKIRYSSYPDINKEVLDKLVECKYVLDDCVDATIYKPE